MSSWNDTIIQEFRDHKGRTAQFGDTLVLLHTVGARSGQAHLVPTASFPDGDDVLVVASKAGAPENPAWYHNLLAHPEIEIERRAADGSGIQTLQVRATQLDGAERDRIWPQITDAAPGFADYQTKTSRVIPVLRLSRI